jgi:hypothetical protein
MKENNLNEAKKYYPKVTSENRVKFLILIKYVQVFLIFLLYIYKVLNFYRNLSDALDLAYETKDEFGINMVLAKCDSNQKTLIEKAKALRNSWQTKK